MSEAVFVPDSNTIVLSREYYTPITTGSQGPQGVQGPRGEPGSAVQTYTSAQNMSPYKVIVFDINGKAIPASCDTAIDYLVAGVTIEEAFIDTLVNVATTGLYTNLAWDFMHHEPIFLGLNGEITQTIPITALFVMVVGTAVTSTTINLGFQPAVFLSV